MTCNTCCVSGPVGLLHDLCNSPTVPTKQLIFLPLDSIFPQMFEFNMLFESPGDAYSAVHNNLGGKPHGVDHGLPYGLPVVRFLKTLPKHK